MKVLERLVRQGVEPPGLHVPLKLLVPHPSVELAEPPPELPEVLPSEVLDSALNVFDSSHEYILADIHWSSASRTSVVAGSTRHAPAIRWWTASSELWVRPSPHASRAPTCFRLLGLPSHQIRHRGEHYFLSRDCTLSTLPARSLRS